MRAGVALVAWLIAAAASAQTPGLLEAIEAGESASRRGDPKTALDRFTAAAQDIDAAAPALRLRALAGLGWAQWANGQYEQSLETRTRALQLARDQRDAAREAVVLRGLGETLYGLGRYDEALARYREGLDAAQRAAAPSEEGLILANMGSTYRNLGRLDEAMEVLERSVALLRPLKTGDISMPYTFLGIVSRARGEYERALGYYGEALATVRAEKNRRQESQILGNMGNVYLDLGRYDRAAALYRESLAIAEQINYAAQIGFAHQNLANVLNTVGRPEEALPHFEKALTTWRSLNRQAQVGYTLNNLGVLRLRHRRDPAGARSVLEEALEIARTIKEPGLEGFALMNLGDLEFNAGRFDAALARYDEAFNSARERNPDLDYQLLDGRGAALHKLGRLDDAIAALRASAAIVNDLRAGVTSDQSKIAFLDTRQAVFAHLADALVDAGRRDEALEAAEAVRARALADLLDDRNVRAGPRGGGSLQALRDAIAASAPQGDVAAALATLRSEHAELASLVSAEGVSAAEARTIARRLNATLVEYLASEESLLIFVVTGDRLDVQRVPVSAAALESRIAALRQLIAAPESDDLAHPERPSALLRELHRDLVAPVARWLPANPDAPLVIVPHGALMQLSFAALLDERDVPLLQRHTLSYAPALSVFRYTQARRAASRDRLTALIVGNPAAPADAGVEPLPSSLDEARAVRRRLGETRSVLLSGANATEAAVKRRAGEFDVLHLATHGLVSEQRPLASALVLAEGQGDDGYLRADELLGLTLHADLVVLSGCSTGSGRLSAEGLLGLTRSFLFAGTASLVVTYWDISDQATVGLMDRFYAALGSGMSKAAALRAAQLETRQRYAHPALWAAFSLQGEID